MMRQKNEGRSRERRRGPECEKLRCHPRRLALWDQPESPVQHVGLRRSGNTATQRAEKSAQDRAEQPTQIEVEGDRAELQHDPQDVESDPAKVEMKDLAVL